MISAQELAEYRAFTATTAVYPREVRAAYLILGLVEETGESSEKFNLMNNETDPALLPQRAHDTAREAGDCWWYLAETLSWFQDVVRELFDPSYDVDIATWGAYNDYMEVHQFKLKSGTMIHLQLLVSKIAGLQKKWIRDGQTMDFDKRKSRLQELHVLLVEYIVYLTQLVVFRLNSTTQEILRINKEKLTDRKDRGALHGAGDNR